MITDIVIDETKGDFEPQRGKVVNMQSNINIDGVASEKDSETIELKFTRTCLLQGKKSSGFENLGTFTIKGRFTLHESSDNISKISKSFKANDTITKLLYLAKGDVMPTSIMSEMKEAIGPQCQDLTLKFLESKDPGYKRK